MSKIKIVIIGSTGQLGRKLLNFCLKNNININAITCFSNHKLLEKQRLKFNIKNYFCFNKKYEIERFKKYILKFKINLIYFLDYGSFSLNIAEFILKNQNNIHIAIANKEMLIAGNKTLMNLIKTTKNSFIPLDSEHFSLKNNIINPSSIKKIYITASGGPFYHKKNVNLENVSLKNVLSHPKWKMGINNSIDSSNFINKILEIFELSAIYNIPLSKIDFLISSEAFIHSIIFYKDHTYTLNCFNNDMLITLTYPLKDYYDIDLKLSRKPLFELKNYKFEEYNDKRFKIFKFYKKLLKLNHKKQIEFMLLNNYAQSLYLNNILKYNQIIDFIMNNFSFNNNNKKHDFKNIKDILIYINFFKKKIRSSYVN